MHHALICLRTQLPFVVALLFSSVFQGAFAESDLGGFLEPSEKAYQTDDGTVPLVWSDPEASSTEDRFYEVRRWIVGGPSEGTLIYEGEDTASFVSGLEEGEHAFRIRSKVVGSMYPEWGGADLIVTVDYIDMEIVWPLMGAGIVCFIVLILTIALGHRAVERKERA